MCVPHIAGNRRMERRRVCPALLGSQEPQPHLQHCREQLGQELLGTTTAAVTESTGDSLHTPAGTPQAWKILSHPGKGWDGAGKGLQTPTCRISWGLGVSVGFYTPVSSRHQRRKVGVDEAELLCTDPAGPFPKAPTHRFLS